MKRRTWKGHQRSASRGRNPLGPLFKRVQKKRKSFTFERLEDRHYFSATPLQTEATTQSNSTPEVAAWILLSEQQWNEMQWASLQASAASQANVPYALPTDPLFADQWHLLNTGQQVGRTGFQPLYGVAGEDINVAPVWDMVRDDGKIGYTGKGVLVAVIDTGVQIGHPDLFDNISPTLRFNAITGTNNPLPTLIDTLTGEVIDGAGHGTWVSGLIGAVWNNGEGGSGVAPDVTLVPIKMIAPGDTLAPIFSGNDPVLEAFRYALDHGVDVTNNSWGPGGGRTLSGLSPEVYDVLREAVEFGRNGLGMINVFASGNGGGPAVLGGDYDSASYNPFLNSRYVIGVTGIDHDGHYVNADGTFTAYPEVGANVLVAAPTGSNVAQDVANDTGQGSGLWTTDLVGDFGLNAAPLPNGFDPDRDPLPDPNYTSRMNGTSSSAPLVTGVIALMLEANPNLTYRDVQEILVRSSRTAAWYESPSAARGDVITGIGEGSGSAAGSGTSAATSNSTTTTSTASGPTANLGAPGGNLVVGRDWGDAPINYDPITNIGYRTTAAELGPSHVYDDTDTTRLLLGLLTDQETDGQKDDGVPFVVTARGDDRPIPPSTVQPNPGDVDDEDGVVGPMTNGVLTLIRGQMNTVSVIAPRGGVLNVWVDLFGGIDNLGTPNNLTNFDERFSAQGTGDHVLTNFTLAATNAIQTFQFFVPATATLNHTFARFRLTSAQYIDDLALQGRTLLSYDPLGAAPGGEVEDYDVQMTDPRGFGFAIRPQDLFSTWQTNQTGPFRDPDPYFHSAVNRPPGILSPGYDDRQYYNPLADPSYTINFPDSFPDNGPISLTDSLAGNDLGRQFASHYELMPGMFANGAGYTVSQGYGFYGDQVGYAHGVIDAELAVQLAKQWTTLGQTKAPGTEKTVTTFVTPGRHVLAAEQMNNRGGFMLVPGGMNGAGGAGFVDYWNEYNADPPAPFNPTSQPWPDDSRGASYIDYVVPPTNQINVEYVEVQMTISGDPQNLNYLRLMLTSPEGTQSELNHYFEDGSFVPNAGQVLSAPDSRDPGVGPLANGTVTVTFSSNRNWGESTNAAVILNAITGEPVAGPGSGDGDPIFRNWELHVENWGSSPMDISNIQIVWHGKEIAQPSRVLTFNPAFPAGTPGLYEPLAAGQNAWDQRWLHFAPDNFDNASDPFDNPANTQNQTPWQVPMAQRIQGSIGIDTNNDGAFNYNRYVQEINPSLTQPGQGLDDEFSADHPRSDAIIRRPDYTDLNRNGIFDAGTDVANQEDFASNVVVALYRVVNSATGQTESTPTAYFLTGADGNFYFDVDPTFEWVIRVEDPDLVARLVTDVGTPAAYMKHFQTEWRITPDWFFAPDHDNSPVTNPGIFYDPTNIDTQFKPGEIFWGSNDANGDGVSTIGPKPYLYSSGQFDDLGAPIVNDRNPIPMAVKNINFLLKAEPATPDFSVSGSVFADLNANGVFDGNDVRVPNATVYIDANRDGAYQTGEISVTTDVNGAYTLPVNSDIPGTYSIGVRLPGPFWNFKQPGTGTQDVQFQTPANPSSHATVNFSLLPPSTAFPVGAPPAAKGWIMGVAFNDLNGNGTRDLGEEGLAGVTMYIDANQNFAFDVGEPTAITASNGTYFFDNVTPDNGAGIWIDVQIADEGTDNAAYTLTTPSAALGGHRVVSLGAGGAITIATFGLTDRSSDDWGDLTNQTLASDNGPHHRIVPGFRLGATNTGEVNGTQSATSTADAGDDGVVVLGGGVLTQVFNTLQVTVFGVGGLLTGWMDFNGDGQFDASEKLSWSLNNTSLGQEADLNPDTYTLQIVVPVTTGQRLMNARFRWGEPGLSFNGPAQIGEVEDYVFVFNATAGDYNGDKTVDNADFLQWQLENGATGVTPFSGADGNGDGNVDQADFDVWNANFGRTYAGSGSGSGAVTVDDGGNQNSSPSGGGLSIAQPVVTETTSSTPPSTLGGVSQAAGLSLSSSSQLTVFFVDVDKSSSAPSTSTSVVRSSSASSDSSSVDLLLLDQTWASTHSSSFVDDHTSLFDDESHEVVCTNDLALAAVLSENDEWWNAI